MLVWHAGIEAAVDQVLRVSDRLRCRDATCHVLFWRFLRGGHAHRFHIRESAHKDVRSAHYKGSIAAMGGSRVYRPFEGLTQ